LESDLGDDLVIDIALRPINPETAEGSDPSAAEMRAISV
jgi:hypothetical protein